MSADMPKPKMEWNRTRKAKSFPSQVPASSNVCPKKAKLIDQILHGVEEEKPWKPDPRLPVTG